MNPLSCLHEARMPTPAIVLNLFPQDQVLSFLKDMFDLDKVHYGTVESLAEDMLHLLHRRSALLLSYLGADCPRNAQAPPNSLTGA